MKFYANLHTHTTHSDGQYSPTEIASIALNEGYGAIAATDHDTITAYPELKAACDKIGMECIFGAEFTTLSDELNRAFHLTAFHFNSEEPRIKEYLRQLSFNETNQTKTLFERGLREGLIEGITWEEVLEYNKSITWLCNNHVFEAMKAKDLKTDADYLPFYRSVYGSRRKEVPKIYPLKQAKELIALIRDAGGIVLIAHPHEQFGYVDTLVDWGIQGLEVWHPGLNEAEQRQALRIAKEKKLFISGGSDHHGLCGGLYKSLERPEESQYFVPPLSQGTTKAFFDEIKTTTLHEDREQWINEYLK